MRASIKEPTKVMNTPRNDLYKGVWDEIHIEYDIFNKHFNTTPYLKGLPNDRDPCPHWVS